jgi:hypothetical protein
MALRSLFRKPAWQHRDPARRQLAINKDNSPALQAALPDIARTDRDTQVRIAAIDRLGDFYLDMRLAYEDDNSEVRAHCLDRYQATLLASSEAASARLGMQERDKLIRRLTDRELLNLLRREARLVEIRQAALETLDQAGAYAHSAVHDSSPKLRELAAQHVREEDALRDIAEQLRTRDKHLHQQLLQRLTELAVARGDTQAVEQQAQSLCQQIEQLMLHTRHASAQHFDHLEQQWQRLEDSVADGLRARYQRARQVVGIACGRLDAPPPVAAAIIEPEAEPDYAAQDAIEPKDTTKETAVVKTTDPTLEALLEQVRQQAASDVCNEAKLAEWRAQHHALQEQLEEHASNQRALEKLEKALRAAEKALQQRAQDARNSGISEKLDDMAKAVDDKLLPPATQAERDILALAKQGGDWPASLSRRWRECRKALAELRSWQRWADNQVRESLCQQAEALLRDRPHPDALMTKLRELRAQWQSLDEKEAASEPSGRPSGGGLRRRFHVASKAAHEIAKPFLDKRDHVRGEHTDQLKEKVEALNALTSQLPNVDWKAVETALRDGRGALRDLPNALPKARKALADQIKQAMTPLSEALDDHQQRIERIKQGLLEQAQNLQAQEEPDANKKAAELMQQWKQAGSAGRRREQKLWKPFRAALDAVSEQSKSKRQEAQQAREMAIAHLQQALNAFDEALTAVESSHEGLAGEAQLALNQAWNEHGHAASKAQQNEHRALHDRAAKHRMQRAHLLEIQQLSDLFQASDSLHLMEQQRLGGTDSTNFDLSGLPDALAKRCQSLSLTPDELQAQMSAQADTANEAVLLMEIAADLPSPADLEQARMQLQVERLNQRLSGGNDDGDLAQMIEHWHAIACLSESDWQAMRPRVKRVEEQLLNTPS